MDSKNPLVNVRAGNFGILVCKYLKGIDKLKREKTKIESQMS